MTVSKDTDPQETQEWLDALEAVIEHQGVERAHHIVEKLVTKSRRSGANLPYRSDTSYINTISPHREVRSPGDPEIEHRIRSLIRWNATVMVLRANRHNAELGGHIASFASSATLYDVGFNHFFHAPSTDHGGDLLFVQGHVAPGIYARAFLEGRLTEKQLDGFRQEATGEGLSSYPHPWLMPDFWQFPTVSMGLGPIMAIYQARFMKYLHDRQLASTANRKVWAFLGDGETDEPESLGAISLAGREGLDNLVFVVNCNLQRLDGPVRGNSKIIQELEGVFRGAGWNVIKVVWGSYWDPLLAKDKDGILQKLMNETIDGEYQNFKAKDGSYTREHFFGKYEQTRDMVATLTDHDIWRLNRGGHDPHKVYAAYHEAIHHKGQPTVILAKTVKGYGMGEAGEGQNKTHSQKKMNIQSLTAMRDRFNIPASDEQVQNADYVKLPEDGPEIQYMKARRDALGGYLPVRKKSATPLQVPELQYFRPLLESSGDKENSTTMSFVRILTLLCRDKNIGKNIVPIVPDEARTFGMEGMFRQLGIYSSQGQLYEPQDKDQIMFYKEDRSGQILEEGINEAGAMSSWIAAGSAYSTHGINMLPFYIYYSMFGFQRIGDLAWAAGDMQVRGFLIGATAGRTTLAGEGLQHQDGHSLLQAATIPNCVAYDPCFAYELAVVIQDGMKRMVEEQENVFFYITTMNENYAHPAMPKGAEKGIIQGMYQFHADNSKFAERVQLIGSGAILREVISAAELLRQDWNVAADIWSAPGINQLRREGLDCERWNTLNPDKKPRIPYVTRLLQKAQGPVIAATDYMRTYADQIRQFVPNSYHVLGTDGYGRSDTRKNLRRFFEVDAQYIVVVALKSLADNGAIDALIVNEAIKKYAIDSKKINPIQA